MKKHETRKKIKDEKRKRKFGQGRSNGTKKYIAYHV